MKTMKSLLVLWILLLSPVVFAAEVEIVGPWAARLPPSMIRYFSGAEVSVEAKDNLTNLSWVTTAVLYTTSSGKDSGFPVPDAVLQGVLSQDILVRSIAKMEVLRGVVPPGSGEVIKTCPPMFVDITDVPGVGRQSVVEDGGVFFASSMVGGGKVIAVTLVRGVQSGGGVLARPFGCVLLEAVEDDHQWVADAVAASWIGYMRGVHRVGATTIGERIWDVYVPD